MQECTIVWVWQCTDEHTYSNRSADALSRPYLPAICSTLIYAPPYYVLHICGFVSFPIYYCILCGMCSPTHTHTQCVPPNVRLYWLMCECSKDIGPCEYPSCHASMCVCVCVYRIDACTQIFVIIQMLLKHSHARAQLNKYFQDNLYAKQALTSLPCCRTFSSLLAYSSSFCVFSVFFANFFLKFFFLCRAASQH